MMQKKTLLYSVSMFMVIFLWITAIIFKILNYADSVTGIFIWVFSLVILAYIGNYKSIDNENDEIKMSEYIAAIGIVTSMSYIACIGFFFGRYVFRSM